MSPSLPQPSPRVLLGMLTPSSNTVLEPVTAALLSGLSQVSAHFGRFRVTEIALSDQALNQFAAPDILRAAALLADARCGVIAWNGTSASWLGFDTDRALCRAIEAETGARACTSVLALNEALMLRGARRIGLVTPYLPAVQDRIVAHYAALGIEMAAERHFGLQDNFSFSDAGEDRIAAAIREVAGAQPDAVVVLCTNLRAAPMVAALEAELGLPIYDSVATAVWKSLALGGIRPARVEGWGSLFQLEPAAV